MTAVSDQRKNVKRHFWPAPIRRHFTFPSHPRIPNNVHAMVQAVQSPSLPAVKSYTDEQAWEFYLGDAGAGGADWEFVVEGVRLPVHSLVLIPQSGVLSGVQADGGGVRGPTPRASAHINGHLLDHATHLEVRSSMSSTLRPSRSPPPCMHTATKCSVTSPSSGPLFKIPAPPSLPAGRHERQPGPGPRRAEPGGLHPQASGSLPPICLLAQRAGGARHPDTRRRQDAVRLRAPGAPAGHAHAAGPPRCPHGGGGWVAGGFAASPPDSLSMPALCLRAHPPPASLPACPSGGCCIPSTALHAFVCSP